MSRIKIKDLKADTKISKEEMKKVTGGIYYAGSIAATPIHLPNPTIIYGGIPIPIPRTF